MPDWGEIFRIASGLAGLAYLTLLLFNLARRFWQWHMALDRRLLRWCDKGQKLLSELKKQQASDSAQRARMERRRQLLSFSPVLEDYLKQAKDWIEEGR
jgi:hypothetical protein